MTIEQLRLLVPQIEVRKCDKCDVPMMMAWNTETAKPGPIDLRSHGLFRAADAQRAGPAAGDDGPPPHVGAGQPDPARRVGAGDVQGRGDTGLLGQPLQHVSVGRGVQPAADRGAAAPAAVDAVTPGIVFVGTYRPEPIDVALGVIAAATRNGTHGATVMALCTRCREWCDGRYFSPSTGGGVGVAGAQNWCKACWWATRSPEQRAKHMEAHPAWTL